MSSKEKIGVLSIILNPLQGRFDSNLRETPTASHNVTTTPTASHLPTSHYHNTHPPQKKTNTMISPACRLPAASILQVSGIPVQPAIAHDLCNMVIQSFYVKPTNPLFYLLLFYVQRLGALVDKRWVFGVITCPFFVDVALKQCALTPAPLIFVSPMPPKYLSCFGMI